MVVRVVVLLSLLGIVSAATNKVVCYHGIWATYRPNNGRFTVDDIDPNLCTHLIYSFVGLETDGRVKHLEPNLDVNLGNLKKFNDLKLKNPKLKTLVAIGGWNEGSIRYSNMAASANLRAVFVKSAVEFVQKWGFDGFDLDWEYPGQRGGAASDKFMLGYNEIVELQKEGGWSVVWDDTQKNTHMFKGDQWVGFDSPKAISLKVEYAKSLNLGGVMIWSIETDDVRGVSGTKYPILKAINQALEGGSNEIVEPAPQPVEEVTQKPAPPSRDLSNLCTKVGYVRDPVDCSIFYYCLPYNGGFVPLEQKCNAGLAFDEEKLMCDYPEVVKC
ncbi:acidic mammalian chitinase-like [Tribolium madens]|uniref:acidic mammalian chitinase-like n=1 Tax=Tribolium madens TaxID=41895 RepID=UPI001CF75AE3|nr:acidic mammalian chitinase-like [Tribolium madens]